MARAKNKAIFSIHGIRTKGLWQDDLDARLLSSGWQHKPFRYGYFSLLSFVRNGARKEIIEKFHAWYVETWNSLEPSKKLRSLYRPSIVAHSFGSFVVANSMLKYREIKFDKIILCGSILTPEFDWSGLLARNQVWRIRNEYGLKDRWAKAVSLIIPGAGDSGYAGFKFETPCVSQERFDFHEHSDYFKIGHCEAHWLPFLERKSLHLNVKQGSSFENLEEFVTTLNRTHEIDNQCFEELNWYADEVIPRGLSTTWIRVNPDIYTFLVDQAGERVVGYINAMPMYAEGFRRVISGEIGDPDIRASDIVEFDSGKKVCLYIMSIAIEPAARVIGQGAFHEGFERLMSGLESKILDYWQRFGTKVTEIGAVGWTDEGRKICDALGLQPRGLDRQGNPTYALQIDDAVNGAGRLGGLMYRLKARYVAGRSGVNTLRS